MLNESKLRELASKQFSNYDYNNDNKEACDAALDWCNRPTRKGLLFYGPTGVGKTHLVAAIANKMIREKEIFTLFLRVAEIPRNDQEEIEKLYDPTEVPILIIDDLGASKHTERMLDCLMAIIDGRLVAGIPLIVTTNQIEHDFEGYTRRITGRLIEACTNYPLGGQDWRKGL